MNERDSLPHAQSAAAMRAHAISAGLGPVRAGAATALIFVILFSGCARQAAIHGGTRQQQTASDGLPTSTGIAVCDDYLASYLACHVAAGSFPPDQLPARYQAMRYTLLRDSQNPAIRPLLGQRCITLTSTLQQALQGKSCAGVPTDAGQVQR